MNKKASDDAVSYNDSGVKRLVLGCWLANCTKYHSLYVPANGFSKCSDRVISPQCNRPPIAILAHCGLLGTSMSPNCR